MCFTVGPCNHCAQIVIYDRWRKYYLIDSYPPWHQFKPASQQSDRQKGRTGEVYHYNLEIDSTLYNNNNNNNQRKLGSNTSELRMTFTWWNCYDEGWCASETWPWNNTSQTDWPWWRVVWDFTLQNNTSQTDWPWWRVVWDFTLQDNTSQTDWPWWRVVWDFTLQNNTSQTDWPWWRVVWDFTLQNNTSQKDWPRWRVVWDFTLQNNTSQTDWPWWRVVWDFTLHNKSSQTDWPWWRVVWDFTLHNNTSQKDWPWWRVVWDMTLHNNTSQKDWPWWRVVWDLCGGCGWGRLVPSMCFATMVVPVCVVPCVSWSCGCRSHWNGCMNVACCVLWGGSQSTKPCVFPCNVAAGDDERYLVCATVAAGVGLSFFFAAV